MQHLVKAFKSCHDTPEMIELQLGAPNAEVCMFFHLLFKAFKSCQDLSGMVDLQLGAPDVEVCVCFSNFCSKLSKVVGMDRK